jgi:hypothetical protein
MSKTSDERREVLENFMQEFLSGMKKEPPEISHEVDENFWSLFSDDTNSNNDE